MKKINWKREVISEIVFREAPRNVFRPRKSQDTRRVVQEDDMKEIHALTGDTRRIFRETQRRALKLICIAAYGVRSINHYRVRKRRRDEFWPSLVAICPEVERLRARSLWEASRASSSTHMLQIHRRGLLG